MKRKRRAAVADASFKPYVRAWRQSLRNQACENERQRMAAIRSAHRLARLLARKHGVNRVALIGSVLRPGAFRDHSDIDLIVWGLPPRDYFTTSVDLEKICNRRVDLIAWESSTPRLRSAFEAEGRVILGEPKSC